AQFAEQPRQIDLYRRAFVELAVDHHVPARLLDEAEHLAQPEPGALARDFGREERLERAIDHLARHAGAGIGDGDLHVLAGREIAVLPAITLVEIDVAGLDSE